MPNQRLESFISSVGEIDPGVVASLREIGSGKFSGRDLSSADDWFSALDAVSAMAASPAPEEPPSFPPGSGAEGEMSLVRQWLGIGRRVGGNVFFGGAEVVLESD
jgi:hypothetical protein